MFLGEWLYYNKDIEGDSYGCIFSKFTSLEPQP